MSRILLWREDKSSRIHKICKEPRYKSIKTAVKVFFNSGIFFIINASFSPPSLRRIALKLGRYKFDTGCLYGNGVVLSTINFLCGSYRQEINKLYSISIAMHCMGVIVRALSIMLQLYRFLIFRRGDSCILNKESIDRT